MASAAWPTACPMYMLRIMLCENTGVMSMNSSMSSITPARLSPPVASNIATGMRAKTKLLTTTV